MTAVDFEVEARVEAQGREQLAEALRACAGRPVRLVGSGSAQGRLPPAKAPVTLISVAPMRKIVRLEADDLTCSVEPGVLREELDAALAERGLCLPCAGSGTLGGIFAAGEHGALAPGAASPRSLLLGLEGLLAEGLPFKCGARVVKSVAGFDLHKLFVGSRGRLFAATLLHLKLRPLPRARAHFAQELAGADEALARWLELRRLAPPPRALVLSRAGSAASVRGTIEGGQRYVGEIVGRLALQPAAAPAATRLEAPPGTEVVAGLVRPGRARELLGLLPPAAPFLLDGGGRFEAVLSPPESDALLAALPRLAASGEIRSGARDRRGLATPGDPGALGVSRRIKDALDPRGMLQ